MKKIISLIIGSVFLFVLAGCKDPNQASKSSGSGSDDVKKLKCQTVLNTKADEVKMLKDFTDTVTELTG
jgi:uncharacterized lipoprotein YehR (DUF1307 family)